MLDQLNVDKIWILNDEALDIVCGGAISGTLVNALTSALKAVLELGRSLGTSIRRIKSRKICKVS